MRSKYIIYILLSFMMIPAYSQNNREKRSEREINRQENIRMLLESREFFFLARTALPSRGTSIDLTTHRSFVRFDTEEIESFMPFYGEAYSGIGFNDPGLHFSGKPEEFELEKKRNNYQVTATVRAEHDNFRLFLTVSPDGNASLTISGNNREPMSYSGLIAEGRND